MYVSGSVPGNKGEFVRIVDAVKGPFYPSPAPMPTYLEPPTQAAEGELSNLVWAPAGDKDPHEEIAPSDPY